MKKKARPLAASDKVVLVGASANWRQAGVRPTPCPGRVYCVREVFAARKQRGVYLVGVIAPHNPHGVEYGLPAELFRRVSRAS